MSQGDTISGQRRVGSFHRWFVSQLVINIFSQESVNSCLVASLVDSNQLDSLSATKEINLNTTTL